MNNKRPISPHITIHKWILSQMMSITHRAAAIGFSLGMLFISLWMLIFVIPLFIIISEPEKNKTEKSTLVYLKQGCLFILKEKLILSFIQNI